MTRALLAILALPLLLGWGSVNLGGGQLAAGSTNYVTQAFFGAISELAAGASATYYSRALGDVVAGAYSLTEGVYFDVVPVDMVCGNFIVSQRTGSIDVDEGQTITIRKCPGGAIGCTWEATAASITTTPDNGTTDTNWTDTDTFTLDAGDRIAAEWVNGANPPDASEETLGIYLECTPQVAYTSVLTGSFRSSATNTYSVPGGATGNAQSTLANTGGGFPLPGAFTLTGFRVSLESLPASDRAFYVCVDDAGTDATCGSVGTQLATCTVTSAGDGTCSTTFSSARNAADLLYVKAASSNASNTTSWALAMTHADRKWAMGRSQQFINLTTELESGQGGTDGTRCNGTNPETYCAKKIASDLTVDAIYGNMTSILTAGTLDVTVRDNEADSATSCTFTTSATTCSSGTDSTLDAGDWINFQFTPSAAPAPTGGGGYSIGVLANDMNDAD